MSTFTRVWRGIFRKRLIKYLTRKPKLRIKYIELLGLNQITAAESSTTRSIVWSLCLLMGLALTVFYLVAQLERYWGYPVGVAVTAIPNSTLGLPAVTVCLNEKFDFHNLRDLWIASGPGGKMPKDADKQLLRYSNLSYADIWIKGGYAVDKLIYTCQIGPGASCSERGKWTSMLTAHGLCFTFSGGVSYMDGHLYGLYIKLKHRNHPYGLPFGGFKIAIHNPKSSSSMVIWDGFDCPVRNKKTGCHILVAVHLRKISLINRPQQPCEEDSSYDKYSCRENCIYSAITAVTGCRLPYMKLPEVQDCQGEEEINRAENITELMLDKGQYNRSNCRCPIACSHEQWLWSTDTTWSTNRLSVIKVYFSSASQDNLKEQYTYSITDLGGDMGGIVGLLLGASLLNVVQSFEVIYGWFCRALASVI